MQLELPRDFLHQLRHGVEDKQFPQPRGDRFPIVIAMRTAKHLGGHGGDKPGHDGQGEQQVHDLIGPRSVHPHRAVDKPSVNESDQPEDRGDAGNRAGDRGNQVVRMIVQPNGPGEFLRERQTHEMPNEDKQHAVVEERRREA